MLSSVHALRAGSNIHTLIEGLGDKASSAQAAWAALQEAPAMPRQSTRRLLPLATRTPAGLQALADAIKACPGARLHVLSALHLCCLVKCSACVHAAY